MRSHPNTEIRNCDRCGKPFIPRIGQINEALKKGHRPRPYCSIACYRNVSMADRFWSKVNKADGCWLWTGVCSDGGYGFFAINRKNKYAHRVCYELTRGPIPEDLLVLHRCDVRACVRPDHLFLGTHEDNANDMVSKGRDLHGERSHHAKLSTEQVQEIRQRYAKGGITQTGLAQEYGVSQPMIGNIVRGDSWKHLSIPR